MSNIPCYSVGKLYLFHATESRKLIKFLLIFFTRLRASSAALWAFYSLKPDIGPNTGLLFFLTISNSERRGNFRCYKLKLERTKKPTAGADVRYLTLYALPLHLSLPKSKHRARAFLLLRS
jgi:hypothetical protein